jgi:hypothetical protein
MKHASKLFGTALALAFSAAALASAADNVLVKFDGGIGATPVRAGAIANNAPLANDVFTITPGGRPWVIRKLEAQVKLNGDIEVNGKGLVLAGGNTVGAPGGITSVFASLFCNGNATSLNTVAVPLSASGDFKIKDTFTTLPPNPCATPVLLIRNASAGVVASASWFAAGIPGTGHDD